MELSVATLAHLRDEAYAFLAEQALLARLEEVERERQNVASTRPPFGMLAGRATREAFAHSMRVVDSTEAVLREQLATITGIAKWLHPIVRQDVSAFLADQSPHYCNLLQIGARLDDWERAFRFLPELLQAYARDLRGVRKTLEEVKKGPSPIAQDLAVLRESAERLFNQYHELRLIEQAALALAPAGSADQFRFPILPDLQDLPWVSRLAVVARDQALAEIVHVEGEVRAFLAVPPEEFAATIQATRELCARLANENLETYWNLLRQHARKYYVEERDIAHVIRSLTNRYVENDLARRQEKLKDDPFDNSLGR